MRQSEYEGSMDSGGGENVIVTEIGQQQAQKVPRKATGGCLCGAIRYTIRFPREHDFVANVSLFHSLISLLFASTSITCEVALLACMLLSSLSYDNAMLD